MKAHIAAIALALLPLSVSQPAAAQGRDLPRECASLAGDRQGDQRADFMSRCLKEGPSAPTSGATDPRFTPQPDRARACDQQAGERRLSGADRDRFMGECLKGAVAPPSKG
jgi:hypothetical protein